MSLEEQSRIEMLERRVNDAYEQRNALAVAFVKMALRLGWPAGRGIDGREENDMDWRHVVYVDLPNGSQVSWHMAPDQVKLLDGLPEYGGAWNGEWTANGVDWVRLLDIQAETIDDVVADAERHLTGFTLNRWHTERRKLQADPDVIPAVAVRILRGYVASWSKKV